MCVKEGGYEKACRLQRGMDDVLRAKKRSSESIATALTRRIATVRGDWLSFGRYQSGERGGRYTVKQLAEAEEEHCCYKVLEFEEEEEEG